jgi:magnesium-transporting ATPase (P-type)
MFEVYAFLLMFLVQVLMMSVMFPAALIRYSRTQAPRFADRFAQAFPGVDIGQSIERFVTRFRATTLVVAVLGLVLLGWLFDYMQRPDWNHRDVLPLTVAYYMAQVVAIVLEVVIGFSSYLKLLRHPSPAGKRTAVLQRRGLFDFVSPFAVFLAAAAYLLFVGFVIYLQQRGMEDTKSAFTLIVSITLVYVLNAVTLYAMLYKSRVFNPLETRESRGPWIGIQVKGLVYSSIFIVAFISIFSVLDVLNQQRWMPFALTAFFVGCSVSFFTSLAAAPGKLEVDGLGESPVS